MTSHIRLLADSCRLSLLVLAALLLMTATPFASADDPVLYLGKIKVSGQVNIVKTLQAIKISLKQPYSNDPEMADIMVCRIEDVPGDNIKKWLTCGTNRALSKNRDAMHSTMMAAVSASNGAKSAGGPGDTGCASQSCYGEIFGILNEAIDTQPGKFMHVQVNGTGFNALLTQIPYPAPHPVTSLMPAAATAPSPAASTVATPPATTGPF